VLAGGGIIGIGAVYVVAAGISGAYAARRLRRISALGRPHVSRRQLRTLVRDSSLVALRDLFEAGALSATILILSSLKGNSSAALLGAAGRLALSIEFVGAAYTVSSLPSLVRAARAGGRQLGRVYETGCRVLVAALLPLSAWCALSARTIARIVFGSGFAAAAGSIRWISATIVLLALSRLATDALVARDRQRLVALFAGLAMVVNLGLSVVLSHSLGAPGGAIALLVAESTFLVFTAAVIARIVEAVSWRRMGLGPAAATAGMCAAVAPLGDSVARLLSAPIVYLVVLYVAERLSNPDDVARVVGWISYSLRYSADAHRRIARRP
jgi:O-antigen/teichoic acid export membrane protein